MLRVLPGLITLGKYLWPLPDRGLHRRLRLISSPTLVVWGEKDKLAPARYADDYVNAWVAFLTSLQGRPQGSREQHVSPLLTPKRWSLFTYHSP